MNKSLHSICTRGGDLLLLSPLLKCTTHRLTVLTSTGWFPSTFSMCWLMSVGTIFFTWRSSVPYFASSTLLCQTAPLLLSLIQQQHVRDTGGKVRPLLPYHWHPPLTLLASITKGIAFGAALVHILLFWIRKQSDSWLKFKSSETTTKLFFFYYYLFFYFETVYFITYFHLKSVSP